MQLGPRHEQTKAEAATRILAAADELLGQGGYEAVSMREVAERAGVTKALVFYHFKGKDELFERVLEGYYQGQLESIERAFQAAEGTLVERLHLLVDRYLDFMESNHRYARLIQGEAVGPGQRHELIRRQMGPVLAWFERALAGVVPEAGPLAAKHFFLTISAAVVNYYTYTPMLGALWSEAPLAPAENAERRAHILWLVDTLVGALVAESERAGAKDARKLKAKR